MATNEELTKEELEQKFGFNLCYFFGHEFVRKHLRIVEDQVPSVGPPVPPVGEANGLESTAADAEREMLLSHHHPLFLILMMMKALALTCLKKEMTPRLHRSTRSTRND